MLLFYLQNGLSYFNAVVAIDKLSSVDRSLVSAIILLSVRDKHDLWIEYHMT